MKKVVSVFIALAIVVGGMFVLPEVSHAAPVDEIQSGVNSAGGNNSGGSLGSRFQDIVNIMLYVLGAIAVIMIVIGGIRYATSNGDSGAVSGAKNTILYAVVGLIVAILAYAIVNFVLTSFK
ncbi:MAG TPA: hypothetical protein VJ841_04140 [Candidatus Saccharimonadales bacterium]|nr:hypothetical protein [Candidatus Saccharimonadales bacterium]